MTGYVIDLKVGQRCGEAQACLHVPLSTLHAQPRDCERLTRGQVGSLGLTCTALSSATPRRFIPAHSNYAGALKSMTRSVMSSDWLDPIASSDQPTAHRARHRRIDPDVDHV